MRINSASDICKGTIKPSHVHVIILPEGEKEWRKEKYFNAYWLRIFQNL